MEGTGQGMIGFEDFWALLNRQEVFTLKPFQVAFIKTADGPAFLVQAVGGHGDFQLWLNNAPKER